MDSRNKKWDIDFRMNIATLYRNLDQTTNEWTEKAVITPQVLTELLTHLMNEECYEILLATLKWEIIT